MGPAATAAAAAVAKPAAAAVEQAATVALDGAKLLTRKDEIVALPCMGGITTSSNR